MRVWHSLAVALGLLLPAACGYDEVPLPPFEVRLQEVFGSAAGLSSPIDLQAPPGDPRLFIAERPGRIRVVENGILLSAPFLNISSRVFTEGEAGLLSFAFDPQFPTNGFVFVHFIENANIPGNKGDIVVERYAVSAGDPNALEPSSVEPVIRIPHVMFDNHYGGRVAFGPDGMLYLSTGDGGGDLSGNGQNTATLLGKLLRLDVGMLPYAIPGDNPTWPSAGRNEIWAIGLRNPFRYAFDAPTGQLYIADVGAGQREEVDRVPADSGGLNYGWDTMEGMLCSSASCNMSGLTLPVYDYGHTPECAIIGGYVYRGAAIPDLQGQYLFSDLCTGWLRSLVIFYGSATVRQAPNVNVGTPLSFGQDGFGEIYVLTADNGVLKVMQP